MTPSPGVLRVERTTKVCWGLYKGTVVIERGSATMTQLPLQGPTFQREHFEVPAWNVYCWSNGGRCPFHCHLPSGTSTRQRQMVSAQMGSIADVECDLVLGSICSDQQGRNHHFNDFSYRKWYMLMPRTLLKWLCSHSTK